MDERFVAAAHAVTRAIEAGGVCVIVAGIVYALVRFGRALFASGGRDGAYRALRSDMGRSILLGLEMLVAADIINTVAVEPTLSSVAVLAVIVAIRTFLSFTLELEIDGRWPWQSRRDAERSANRDVS